MSQIFSRSLLALAFAFLSFVPAGAGPADLTYSVSGIHVDASGPSASAAQAIAIDQGRPRAWDILYKRLARQNDWSKEPKLDNEGLHRIARGFSVNNEKRSTTRYVADVTYVFSPEAVARVMSGISNTYRLTSGRRILLIPMSPGFNPGSGWANAFASPRFGASSVQFAVPTGEAPDVVALEHLDFDATTWVDVQRVAARIHASEAVLALAIPLTQGGTSMTDKMTGKVQIWLKRIGISEAPMKTSVDVPLVKNVVQTYPLAADAAVHAIEVMFQQKPAIDFGPRNSLTADVQIDSLAQWATMQTAMTSVPNVVAVQTQAMDIGLVRISLIYQGSTDQLHDALAPAGVALTRGSDGWSMAYATPTRPSSTASTP
ncbi:MAG TPA: hypothetical protein VHZ78_09820 [Rhizomicrobium sp.]|jgi:hypothetical protein|nr:hypothetical protein [Rhizomicrobium sp.]